MSVHHFILVAVQLGPNVSIGAHATISYGTRIKESIVLAHSRVLDHSLVLYSIIGKSVYRYLWSFCIVCKLILRC
jgi:NDP-sugar pyrophosphorylase family protein